MDSEDILSILPSDPYDIVEMKREIRALLEERESARLQRLATSDPVEKKLLAQQYDRARRRAHKIITKVKSYYDPALAEKLKDQKKASRQREAVKKKKQTQRRKYNKRKWKEKKEEIELKSQSDSLSDLIDVLEHEGSLLAWRNERTWFRLKKKVGASDTDDFEP